MKRSGGEKVFSVFNYILMILVTIVTLYPVIYVAAASLSSPDRINMGDVWIFPKGFTIEAYKKMLTETGIPMGFANSLFLLVFGTAFQMVITLCGAYPLSRKDLPGKRAINFMVAVAMWLNPGLIPMYLNYHQLGMLDTRIGYIIGFACSIYNFVILRSYFMSVPDALEEAAKIDGASDVYILTRVFIPVSLPAIATVCMFYIVGTWNTYFWPMIFFKTDSKMPLQVLLRTLVVEMGGKGSVVDANVDVSLVKTSAENVTYATIMLTIAPMLILYPYIQKFFVKGIMVGSVKG